MSNKLVPYGYIYKTTNKINGKIYIGQHKGQYHDLKYFGSGVLLNKAIIKYGIKNFSNEVIDWANSIKELDEKERYYISYYKETLKERCYNIQPGGHNPMTEETKEKLRISSTGKKHSIESKKKLSKAHKGKVLSNETKKKISESLKNKPQNLSEKQKQDIKELFMQHFSNSAIERELKIGRTMIASFIKREGLVRDEKHKKESVKKKFGSPEYKEMMSNIAKEKIKQGLNPFQGALDAKFKIAQEKARKCFELRAKGYTRKKIAEITGINESSVKQYFSKGREYYKA